MLKNDIDNDLDVLRLKQKLLSSRRARPIPPIPPGFREVTGRELELLKAELRSKGARLDGYPSEHACLDRSEYA